MGNDALWYRCLKYHLIWYGLFGYEHFYWPYNEKGPICFAFRFGSSPSSSYIYPFVKISVCLTSFDSLKSISVCSLFTALSLKSQNNYYHKHNYCCHYWTSRKISEISHYSLQLLKQSFSRQIVLSVNNVFLLANSHSG